MGIIISCQKYKQEIILIPDEIVLPQEEMVLVPGGNYNIGTDDYILSTSGTTDMLPSSIYNPKKVTITDFKISNYEISSELFLTFLEDVGRNRFDYDDTYTYLVECNGQEYFGYLAVSSYYYALDFCKWLGKRDGKIYRLPTDAEWEYAATGGDGRMYPWGNTYKALGDKEDELGSSRVLITRFHNDISPFGIMNMFGNVAEWVLDYYQYDAYLSNPIVNPVCIDGTQKSIDRKYLYPPTYVVRGINKYYYSLDNIEPHVDDFATIKRRYPYWHRLVGYPPRTNIGFRIVEDINNGELMSIHGPVTYHYETYKTIEDADIFLIPNDSSELLMIIKGNEYFQSLFMFRDKNDSLWLRIQTFDHSEYTGGTKMGDDGVVGWIKLEYCEKME